MSASAAHSHAAHDGEHVSSLGTYLTIYGLLLILTFLTVAVSRAELPGNASIGAALGVAAVKSFLVAGWFMHLKYDTKFNVMVFLSALWFTLVFFSFTLLDLGSRGDILELTNNHALQSDRGEKMAQPAVIVGHGGHGGGHEAAPEPGHEAAPADAH